MFATSAHRDILMVLCRLTRYGLAIVTAVMYWLWEVVLCLIKASFYTVVGMVRALLPSCHSKLPDFSADVCLVTGAAQGLGRQLALKFAECGATLVLWDINEEKVFAVAEEVRALGNEAFAYVCDCSKREEIYRVAERVRREVGDVAILVNNAGVVTGKRLLENSDADIEKTFQVNTLSHYWVSPFNNYNDNYDSCLLALRWQALCAGLRKSLLCTLVSTRELPKIKFVDFVYQ